MDYASGATFGLGRVNARARAMDHVGKRSTVASQTNCKSHTFVEMRRISCNHVPREVFHTKWLLAVELLHPHFHLLPIHIIPDF